MNRTRIEWADFTWNPIVGCLNNCPYCYAYRMARRFDCFPTGFLPTFYRHRLNEPQTVKKPQNIFVCSMSDMFGDWISEKEIRAIFEACNEAPQHRYIFLTKNPERLHLLTQHGLLPKSQNFWYGTTVPTNEAPFFYSCNKFNFNAFLSIEPMQSNFSVASHGLKDVIQWIIVGAETGNRKGKIVPKREWIENIVESCKNSGVPLFMKNSLADIWGEPLIQEYPWEVEQ